MSVAAFIAAQRTTFGVPHAVACRAVEVSESWFYKWHDRPPTARRERLEELDAAVEAAFEASGGQYGSPRIHSDLIEAGRRVSVNTVAASMARQGLVARVKKRRRNLTQPDKRKAPFPDLLERDFTAPAPNVKWVGDGTEIPTLEGKLYLATVEDLFSRAMPGFAMSEHHDAELACDALRTAVAFRGGNVDGVIFHSDRGSEYTSEAMDELCGRLGVRQSMGRVGSALDNAAAESFNSTLEFEVLSQRTFATKDEARLRVATWIVDRYNVRRRHSSAAMLPPLTFERLVADVVAGILRQPPVPDSDSTCVDSRSSSMYVDSGERREAAG